jgi:uncharacterized protein YxeA
MKKILFVLICCVALVGCGGSEVKKEVEKKEEKKWVRNETEEYKKVVADYELVGKWEEDQSSSGYTTSVYEIYKKGKKHKLVWFYGDGSSIRDLKKKGEKYIDVKSDAPEYFIIVDGVLQLWYDKENTNYIFKPIDW